MSQLKAVVDGHSWGKPHPFLTCRFKNGTKAEVLCFLFAMGHGTSFFHGTFEGGGLV